MTILLRIAERALNRPLLIHPDKVPLILGILEGRIPIGEVGDWREQAEARIAELPPEAQTIMRGPAPEASRFFGSREDVDPETGRRTALPYRRTADGVAVITITGTLINRGAWVGSYSGETSYEGIKHQLATAAADPRARAILLDIESPGGEAVGAMETAAAVRAAAKVKPVTAAVNGMAASAAYAIASGASQIVTTPSGVVGSIGVVLLHADYSRFLDKKGITPTLIFAGAHKVDGNPFEPLPEGVRDDLQREVNQFYDLFVATVAEGRRAMSPQAIRATEARVFIGQDAVDAGLADAVGSFEEALAIVTESLTARDRAQKGATMSNKTGQPGAENPGNNQTAAAPAARQEDRPATAAELAQAFPDLVAAIRTDAATAERNRILGIEQHAMAGHEKVIADCKADPSCTPDQAAGKVLQAEKQVRGGQLASIAAVETETAKVTPAPSQSGDDGVGNAKATTPEGWAAEWAGSDKLKAEFATGADYVAFKKAEAAGKVRVLHGKAAS